MSSSAPIPNPKIFDFVGKTPLVPVGLAAGDPEVYCKLEYMNPSGSVKDRIAVNILLSAWRRGEVAEGTTVVEASSGSTSIALAHACCHLGLRFVAVMTPSASEERRLTITAHGGEVVTVPDDDMNAAQNRARELGEQPGWFHANQFENPDNPSSHAGTAEEILEVLHGIDAVVSGVGTGGTLVGMYEHCARSGVYFTPVVARLKQPVFRLLSIGFTCAGFDCHFVDLCERDAGFRERVRVVEVEESAAIQCMLDLWAKGFPVGPASAVNFLAAREFAGGAGGTGGAAGSAGAKVVTFFTDRLERYFSTRLVDHLKDKVRRQAEQEQRKRMKKEIVQEVLAALRHGGVGL